MTGLVIGASGQISRSLQRTDLDAVYLDRRSLDLESIGRIRDSILSFNPDYIVNAAAYTAVDEAEFEEATATVVNGTAVGELARVAAETSVPFVHISTDYVFSGAKDSAYSEDDPTSPINAYGRSKLVGEQMIAANASCTAWVLRTSWVFSEFGSNFVRTMLRLASQGIDPLRIVGDQMGRPTYAGDIADAIRRILARWNSGKPIPRGIYHCASGGVTTWAEFALKIFQRAEELGLIVSEPEVVAIRTEEYPTSAARPMNSVLDTSKLSGTLGWQPPGWRLGLDKVLVDLREGC